MHILTILLKSNPQVLQFHFDHYKDADKVLAAYRLGGGFSDGLFKVDDDYGSKSATKEGDIAGIFITDLNREMKAHEAVELAKYSKDYQVQKKVKEMIPGTSLHMPSATGRVIS